MAIQNIQKLTMDFDKAYRSLSQIILKHIFFRTSNVALAEDLTQDVFLKTWQYVISKRTDRVKNYKKFIYMVANNLIIDYYRQKHKQTIPIKSDFIKNQLIDKNELKKGDIIIELAIVDKYISRLRRTYRDFINYRYFRELSISEISELTGKSPNYVSVILHRSILSLQKKIGQVSVR